MYLVVFLFLYWINLVPRVLSVPPLRKYPGYSWSRLYESQPKMQNGWVLNLILSTILYNSVLSREGESKYRFRLNRLTTNGRFSGQAEMFHSTDGQLTGHQVLIKFLLPAVYNAYILEGYKTPHNGRGTRKRVLLKFKQILCVQLVETTPTRNKAAKRQRQNMPPEDCLENVGSHLPLKGEGNDHQCVVCEKKKHKGQENWGNPKKDQLQMWAA